MLQSLLFAVALAVGLTPEFRPMITSVTLSKGAVSMAHKKVIVKHLSAIQNLGSLDVLCSDKTGNAHIWDHDRWIALSIHWESHPPTRWNWLISTASSRQVFAVHSMTSFSISLSQRWMTTQSAMRFHSISSGGALSIVKSGFARRGPAGCSSQRALREGIFPFLLGYELDGKVEPIK